MSAKLFEQVRNAVLTYLDEDDTGVELALIDLKLVCDQVQEQDEDVVREGQVYDLLTLRTNWETAVLLIQDMLRDIRDQKLKDRARIFLRRTDKKD